MCTKRKRNVRNFLNIDTINKEREKIFNTYFLSYCGLLYLTMYVYYVPYRFILYNYRNNNNNTKHFCRTVRRIHTNTSSHKYGINFILDFERS